MTLDRTNRQDNSIITATAWQLGVQSITIFRYVTGQQYPMLPAIRKIEEEFGWSVEEQIRLIPDAGNDLGYGMVLAEVMKEHFADSIDDPNFPPRSLPIPVRRKRLMTPGWTHAFVADHLGIRTPTFTRYLNGTRYPEVRAMLRIERLLRWKASSQIRLVPAEGYDMRYAIAFREKLDKKYPVKEEQSHGEPTD
jgi:hypothetical protein